MDDFQVFRERLENEHHWPEDYIFKFVAPKENIEEVKSLFEAHQLSERQSKTGKYISITAKIRINNTDEVIEIYKKAHLIKGVIAL